MTSRLQVACIHDLCAWSTAECVSEELVTKRMECQQNAAFIHLIYSTLCLCKFFVSFFFFSKVCFCHTLKYDLWVLQGSEAVMCCCVIQPANVCCSPDPLRQDTDNLPADLFFLEATENGWHPGMNCHSDERLLRSAFSLWLLSNIICITLEVSVSTSRAGQQGKKTGAGSCCEEIYQMCH